MVNRKHFALAAAIALFTPLGVSGAPVDEVVGRSTNLVGAELASLDGVPIPRKPVGGVPLPPAVTQEVVEGHAVFAVVEVQREYEQVDALAVVGEVSCTWSVIGSRLPAQNYVSRFTPGCRPGDSVIVAERGAPPPSTRGDLVATGWEFVVESPATREPVLVREHRYRVEDTAVDGRPVQRWAFAWETEVRPLEVNPHSGRAFNFVGAVNLDRVTENGIAGVTVWTGDDWF